MLYYLKQLDDEICLKLFLQKISQTNIVTAEIPNN